MALTCVPIRAESSEGVQATTRPGSSGSAGWRHTWTAGPSPPVGATRVSPGACALDRRAVVAHRYSVVERPLGATTTAVYPTDTPAPGRWWTEWTSQLARRWPAGARAAESTDAARGPVSRATSSGSWDADEWFIAISLPHPPDGSPPKRPRVFDNSGSPPVPARCARWSRWRTCKGTDLPLDLSLLATFRSARGGSAGTLPSICAGQRRSHLSQAVGTGRKSRQS